MLTLYYVGATFLQSWRIKSVCSKIAEKLAQQASIAFYTLPDSGDGYDAHLATSELCTNRAVATVSDILWLHGDNRGCCLLPRQNVLIGPWISFPEGPSWLPFVYDAQSHQLTQSLEGKQQQEKLYLLLETEIDSHPCKKQDAEYVKIEEYGKLIAWKIDSQLALLLETDLEHFTKLLISTFLQNNLLINDQLPLIRIESISFEGKAQPFSTVSSHLGNSTRSSKLLSGEEWSKHLEGLHALSILANQVVEFEYNKNRTEGKTGVIKPDLIPYEKQQKSATRPVVASPSSHTVSAASNLTKISTPEEDSKCPNTVSAKQLSILKTKQTVKNIKPEIISETVNKIPETISAQPQTYISTMAKKPKSKSSQAFFDTTFVTLEEANKMDSSNIIQKQSSVHSVSVIKDTLRDSKPLNILVYSDSVGVRENVIVTLKDVVDNDMYTIYTITPHQVEQKYWFEDTALLVVCGAVASNIGEILVDFFLNGGKMLSLCSDILHIVLPSYRTAEVREHELVQFSYDRWGKVKMMHHIFCFQPSPVKKNFSTDIDDSTPIVSKKPALVCPRSVELKDLAGEMHNLDVEVLSTEEIWNTPSLLVAKCAKSGGKTVFSQVHLESNPAQFEAEESKKQSDRIRLEIISDLLSKHLNVLVKQEKIDVNARKKEKCVYKSAYFLGQYEAKFKLLRKLNLKDSSDNLINTSKLAMHFCDTVDNTPRTNANVLPVLIHSCPEDFSTVDYFDLLKTTYVGRLVIYAPEVCSSMNVITELELTNGLAVLVRHQTEGMGRNCNQWLSPPGCAMFSIQLHVLLDGELGSRLSLIQHIVATSVVNAIKTHDTYKVLDLGVKWPNDIYANRVTKIGGIIVKTTLNGNTAVVNIGCGVNLDNSKPTTCINDLITYYNLKHGKSLPALKYEQFVAMIFNEFERLMEVVQSGNFEAFYEIYYNIWLHNNQKVYISNFGGKNKEATVLGIDSYGYLKVKFSDGSIESVQTDGNSFDMLKGLIVAKFN